MRIKKILRLISGFAALLVLFTGQTGLNNSYILMYSEIIKKYPVDMTAFNYRGYGYSTGIPAYESVLSGLEVQSVLAGNLNIDGREIIII